MHDGTEWASRCDRVEGIAGDQGQLGASAPPEQLCVRLVHDLHAGDPISKRAIEGLEDECVARFEIPKQCEMGVSMASARPLLGPPDEYLCQHGLGGNPEPGQAPEQPADSADDRDPAGRRAHALRPWSQTRAELPNIRLPIHNSNAARVPPRGRPPGGAKSSGWEVVTAYAVRRSGGPEQADSLGAVGRAAGSWQGLLHRCCGSRPRFQESLPVRFCAIIDLRRHWLGTCCAGLGCLHEDKRREGPRRLATGPLRVLCSESEDIGFRVLALIRHWFSASLGRWGGGRDQAASLR